MNATDDMWPTAVLKEGPKNTLIVLMHHYSQVGFVRIEMVLVK